MQLLSPEQEQKLRDEDPSQVDVADWHRFLRSICHQTDLENGVITRKDYPGFKTYCQWKHKFPGWTHGMMTFGNIAFKQNYVGAFLPMNKYYENMVY